MKKILESATWMWNHRGKNIWWAPGVLTSNNQDPNAPKLNNVEAISVFKTLEEHN